MKLTLSRALGLLVLMAGSAAAQAVQVDQQLPIYAPSAGAVSGVIKSVGSYPVTAKIASKQLKREGL